MSRQRAGVLDNKNIFLIVYLTAINETVATLSYGDSGDSLVVTPDRTSRRRNHFGTANQDESQHFLMQSAKLHDRVGSAELYNHPEANYSFPYKMSRHAMIPTAYSFRHVFVTGINWKIAYPGGRPRFLDWILPRKPKQTESKGDEEAGGTRRRQTSLNFLRTMSSVRGGGAPEKGVLKWRSAYSTAKGPMDRSNAEGSNFLEVAGTPEEETKSFRIKRKRPTSR